MAVSTQKTKDKKLDPRVEKLLKLIIEAKRSTKISAANARTHGRLEHQPVGLVAIGWQGAHQRDVD
jgi:hypothetical protein